MLRQILQGKLSPSSINQLLPLWKASIDENNPNIQGLREFVSNNLTQKRNHIYGASIVKTYWEKRKYLKVKGAKKDFTGFTCAVFIRMKKDRLENAVDKAANFIAKADDPKQKTM